MGNSINQDQYLSILQTVQKLYQQGPYKRKIKLFKLDWLFLMEVIIYYHFFHANINHSYMHLTGQSSYVNSSFCQPNKAVNIKSPFDIKAEVSRIAARKTSHWLRFSRQAKEFRLIFSILLEHAYQNYTDQYNKKLSSI